mgnify:CR=1 FL=1
MLITEKGKLAANIKECHSLVMSEFIVDNKELLKDMTAKDLAIVFSIFTNIRVKEDQRARWYEASISEISRKGIKKINEQEVGGGGLFTRLYLNLLLRTRSLQCEATLCFWSV